MGVAFRESYRIHTLPGKCKQMLKRVAKKALRMAGKHLVSSEEIEFYRNLDPAAILYSEVDQECKQLIAPFLPLSRAQLAQDLFALAASGTTEPRYFVEFGATDGVSLSNTWLLEKQLGWDGILAEPARIWHDSLRSNRSCSIETRCVAGVSGQKTSFLEVECGVHGSPELSSIESYANNGDWASKIRLKESTAYEVETISLGGLLDEHNAPGEIQFLSIDTEGSEFEILKQYDFGARKIRSICVEHNYQKPVRSMIHALLRSHGYRQVLANVSRFDDWYVLNAD